MISRERQRSELDGGRNEQRQVLHWDVRGKRRRTSALTKGGGENSGATVQGPIRASSFLCGFPTRGTEEAQLTRVGGTARQCCEAQSLHTVPCHLPGEKMPNQPARFINSRERGWSNPRLRLAAASPVGKN